MVSADRHWGLVVLAVVRVLFGLLIDRQIATIVNVALLGAAAFATVAHCKCG